MEWIIDNSLEGIGLGDLFKVINSQVGQAIIQIASTLLEAKAGVPPPP